MSALAWVLAMPWQQLGAIALLLLVTCFWADELGSSERGTDDE